MAKYSALQLWTLKNFGKTPYFQNKDNEVVPRVVNVGPVGVGKTYIIMEAFGLYCMELYKLGYRNLYFALVGKTYNAIRRNMLNVLAKLFGSDFKYDHSTINGITCDGRLFGFPLFFVPLNDSTAYDRIHGLSDITGVIIDELTLISEETYNHILSRLRGGEELPEGYVDNWMIASTNPDSPRHWVLINNIETGAMKQIRWRLRDACYPKFRAYIEGLKRLYRNLPTLYERYILGRWKAAEGLVFASFSENNVLSADVSIDYSCIKRTWISCDYGSNHKTSIQVHHINYNGIRFISEVQEYTRTAVSTITQHILELYDRERERNVNNKKINIYVDPAAQTLCDELRKNKLIPFNAKNEHLSGISYVNEQFELKKLYILRNAGTQKLIDEIYSYKYNDKESAKDGSVVKINDDHCDAMRYGIFSDAKYNNEL